MGDLGMEHMRDFIDLTIQSKHIHKENYKYSLRVCSWCNSEFLPNTSRQKFCSTLHGSYYRKNCTQYAKQHKQYQKQYRLKNKEYFKKKHREWSARNFEREAERGRNWRQLHPDYMKNYMQSYNKKIKSEPSHGVA